MQQSDNLAPVVAVEYDRRREQRLTYIILLVAGLARLPFLWHGFGGHPDEWYAVRSGLDFWLHGTYYPSRAPLGNPLNEIMMGGLAWLGGSSACAAAAMGVSLVTLAYLRALAPLYGIRNSFWPILALSFGPWFWSSGTHCLDYIWGTASLVAALYYVERRQVRSAGFVCALGFGFRPSSLLWIIPLFSRVALVERRWQRVLRFVIWAAIPALVPVSLMVLAIARTPDEAWTATGDVTFYVSKAARYPLVAPMLAFYHFTELMGQIPGLLLIGIACFANRHCLYMLFKSREGWVWNNGLIFVLLFAMFLNHSDKPEYMLPALPGLFLILGGCMSDNWWKAVTVVFIVNAFVSLGFGHAPAWGQPIEAALPSLRAGALLWYAGKAKADNEAVSRIGPELSQQHKIIRADRDNLTAFYVSSLLKRGPASQARISCPLVEMLVSFPKDQPPNLSLGNAMDIYRALHYPVLICCDSMSALVPSNMPASPENELEGAVTRFCASRTASP